MRIIRITICSMLIYEQKKSPMIRIGASISPGLAPESVARGKPASPGVASSATSESLLGERGELKIQHNGEQYSLRRTRHGKLILTK